MEKNTNACFLGVVEEDQIDVIKRVAMDVKIAPNFVTNSASGLNNRLTGKPKDPTMTSKYLVQEISKIISLFITNPMLNINMGHTLTVWKIGNMQNDRFGRTILEVSIPNFPHMALKCVGEKIGILKNTSENDLVILSAIQQEALAFDKLPATVRKLFPTKYGHGRIWFSPDLLGPDFTCEVILMELCCFDDLRELMVKKIDTEKTEIVRWWALAADKLYALHIAGFTHGDAHLSNFIFTDRVGGNMKIIDIERMRTLADLGDGPDGLAYRNLYKLCDIYHFLFHNVKILLFLGEYT